MTHEVVVRRIARISVIVYAVFLSMFALDIFGEGYGFWELVVGLFMHLLPSIILVAVILLSWHRERIGGIVFIVLGIVFTFFFKTYQDGVVFLLISFPVLLAGILFIVADKLHEKK